MKTCRIFAGGVIDDTSHIRVEAGDIVICADRGYEYASALGIKPDILVGDFDSYSGELPGGIEIHRSVPEKDDTDTMLAVRTALERGAEKIVLYGGTGGRIDHTIANIQTMTFEMEHGGSMIISDSRNEMMLAGAGEHIFPLRENWYFSVFAVSDEVHIDSMTGVKYPLTDYTLTRSFPLGVSNEIASESAYLEISSGTALIVRSAM